MEQIRSFIAIELPDELKAELSRLQVKLKSGNVGGVRWVDPRSIHLTLKFLGDVSIDKVNEIAEAMGIAAQGISPFNLVVNGLGAFPDLKRVQVIWVGVGGDLDKLAQLQQGIDSSLDLLGFSPEERLFTPHLTLARLRSGVMNSERQVLGELIAKTKFQSDCAIEVDHINLMKSELTREGAIYSRVISIKLEEPH